MNAALVFALTFATDWIWVSYVRSASSGRVLRAAISSALLVLFGSLATIACVDDHRLIPLACLGAFAGTLVSMRIAKT